jgi:hypothetical protein
MAEGSFELVVETPPTENSENKQEERRHNHHKPLEIITDFPHYVTPDKLSPKGSPREDKQRKVS